MMLFASLSALAVWLLKGLTVLASYVTNGNVFPKPLSEEEEKKLLERKAAGDMEARNILVERNLRLVAHVMKKYDTSAYGEDPDDLISIGTIGLIKAINTFDPGKNTRLATYAAKCIQNEILMYLRMKKKVRSEVFLYDKVSSDSDGNEQTYMDRISGENVVMVSDEVETKMEEQMLRDKFRCLLPREKKVIEMRYGIDNKPEKTQREISKLLGISRSYVSRIEKRALSKLAKEMLSEGYQ